MSDKNPIQKTLNYIEKHNLREKVTLNENGSITWSEDLHETTAAMDAGLSLDQVKKLQKADAELLNAATYLSGELAVEAFTRDPNLTETGFNYTVGSTTKVSGIFNRDQKDHVVVAVENTHRNAEFNRVATTLNSMFNDINS